MSYTICQAHDSTTDRFTLSGWPAELARSAALFEREAQERRHDEQNLAWLAQNDVGG
jgi:hypothetical protein